MAKKQEEKRLAAEALAEQKEEERLAALAEQKEQERLAAEALVKQQEEERLAAEALAIEQEEERLFWETGFCDFWQSLEDEESVGAPDFASMKVIGLKQECKSRKITSTGNKAVLIKRLQAFASSD